MPRLKYPHRVISTLGRSMHQQNWMLMGRRKDMNYSQHGECESLVLFFHPALQRYVKQNSNVYEGRDFLR